MAAHVVFFTGPSAAGKTTTARAWAESRPTPTAHLQGDLVRSLVRHGPRSAEQAAAGRGDGEAMIAQYFLSASVCAAMARTYLERGIDVAIDSQRSRSGPPEWAGEWDEVDALSPVFVVLLPRLEVALARNETRRRPDGTLWMQQDDIRAVYEWDWGAWRAVAAATILDTSDLDLGDTLRAVDAIAAEWGAGGG